jgi:enterochelin esterase family protein
VPSTLDSLIAAGAVRPTIGVMIENGSGEARLNDLANRARFAAFVTDELIPWVQARYKVSHDPAHVVVTGSSAGGLAAGYVAFRRPDLIGNVLSQSGAFWRGNEASNAAPWEWLTAQYAAAARKPIRFVMEVGSTESGGALGGAAPSILEANRHLRDVLQGKGYQVTYVEVPNGVHSPATWAPRLPIGLSALLGRR